MNQKEVRSSALILRLQSPSLQRAAQGDGAETIEDSGWGYRGDQICESPDTRPGGDTMVNLRREYSE